MNEKKLDRILPEALAAAAQIDLTAAEPQPCPAAAAHIYEKMLDDPWKWRRKKLRPAWQKGLQLAASFAIVCILGFSALLAVSPSANAAFTTWFATLRESSVQYTFLGNSDTILPTYKLTALPEDAELDGVYEFETGMEYEYLLADGNYLSFSYEKHHRGNAFSIVTDNMEVIDVEINGCPGQLYESLDSAVSSAIVWTDEDAHITFCIDMHAEADELLRMAESVRVCE